MKTPKFEFTPEQAEAFSPYQHLTVVDGRMIAGHFKGTLVADCPTTYLEKSIAHLVSHAIIMQKELNKRSVERRDELIERFPDHANAIMNYWERHYGVPSEPATVQPLCSPPTTSEAHDNEIQIQVRHQ